MPDELDDKDLIEAINSSAEHINAATLAFLAASVYMGVAVASTTHELLLFGTSIPLPILDVKVPLKHFFFIAPLILWTLHLHLLLQQYLVAHKLAALPVEETRRKEPLLTPALPVSVLVGNQYRWIIRGLLWVLLFAVNVVLPVGLLLFTQSVFVPYHSAVMTTWHEFLVMTDLLLIWYFFLRTPTRWDVRITELGRLRTQPSILLGVVTAAVVFISGIGAQGPGSGYQIRFNPRFHGWFLRSQMLRLGEELKAKQPGPGAHGEERGEAPPRLDFRGRDLRGADLTGAELAGADFRGANLDGAILVNANLRGARFTPWGGPDVLFDEPVGNTKRIDLAGVRRERRLRPTSLRHTNLAGADLREAKLIMANLRQADLREAHLEGAELLFADLGGADLSASYLAGADLFRANLEMADLRHADLRAADLARASVIGADLQGASMTAADLHAADLRSAHLVGVRAWGADFADANTLGADLRASHLQRSSGLALRGVRLRGAEFGGSKCASDMPRPEASDLREVNLDDVAVKDWEKEQNELATVLKSPDLLAEAMKRMSRGAEPGPACLPAKAGDIAVPGVLYEGGGGDRSASGLAPTAREAEYQQSLTQERLDDACDEPSRAYPLAAAWMKEMTGGYTPRDPPLEAEMAGQVRARLGQIAAEKPARYPPVCQSLRRMPKGVLEEAIRRALDQGPLAADWVE